MKKEFSWYFSPSDAEIDEIWKKGLLTVDANVLLDLYRYHESTRNSLISSLKNFEGTLWLSRQAAEEFFRNRNKVIVSSEKTFKQASEEVEKLRGNFEATVNQLKGNRIIPAEVADSLIQDITPAIDKAQDNIIKATSAYPKFLQSYPILEDLSEMFENSIGSDFKEDELGSIREEAELRKKNKVPPGYLDQDKDGDRPYGDFFLWRQINIHSKEEGIPIIFITSERKEDWWEKISGKTIGPRQELLREAYEFCGHRILIYQTDRFLEFASKRSGGNVDDSAVEEIRAVDTLRSEIEHVVELIEQRVETCTESKHEGVLILNLRRPVRNLTGSGRFDPYMHDIPSLTAVLIDAPPNMPQTKIGAGTGTNYDFNLHLRSKENDTLLPIGQYIIQYTAICEEPDSSDTLTEDLEKI